MDMVLLQATLEAFLIKNLYRRESVCVYYISYAFKNLLNRSCAVCLRKTQNNIQIRSESEIVCLCNQNFHAQGI